MKNVVIIPKEKSYDMNFMKDVIEQMCSTKSNGTHACCSGESMELRIAEDQIDSLKRSNASNEKIYIINEQGKIVQESV